MKVAFVSQSLAGGGQERVTANLANSLSDDSNMSVIVITAEESDNDYTLSEKVKRYSILENKLLSDSKKLRAILNTNSVDVVVGMGIYANFLCCMSNFFLKTRVIISERNDPVHDRLSIKSKIFRFVFYRFADGYIFQTEGARAFYSKKIQEKGVIIPNPLKDGIPYKSNICNKEIVAVGRLSPQKNYSNLIGAFAETSKRHPEYILRIFGTGELEENLKNFCRELKISDKVVFEGFCTDVHEKIKDSDIFVLSSDFEGMPNSLMEAMAMGFPVISTDCPSGGPKSLIENEGNGLLVPVNDSNQLADALNRLIEDESFKKELGKNAIIIRNLYSQENISKLIKKMLTNNIGV